MFKRHYEKRSPNIVIVIFRLVLSMFMFAVLVVGIYSAYKHFSGLDPLKLDPQAVLSEVLAGKIPDNLLRVFSGAKLTQGLANQISQKVLGRQTSQQIPAEDPAKPATSNPSFRFLLLADSHSDNVNLEKAISQAKQTYPDLSFIIGLGDYTDVGTIKELKNAKTMLDSAGLRYFLIPGDHDLWDCRNRSLAPTACFNEVFGPDYQSFIFQNYQFLMLNNSDDYKGLGEEQERWIESELEKAKAEQVKGIFVFIHEPLFHPSSDHVMGKIEKSLKTEAKDLIFQLKTAEVKKVFAGDSHFFSEYQEPVTGISMVTVGAVTIERNPQVPRFAVVSVFEDGSTKVEDVEITELLHSPKLESSKT